MSNCTPCVFCCGGGGAPGGLCRRVKLWYRKKIYTFTHVYKCVIRDEFPFFMATWCVNGVAFRRPLIHSQLRGCDFINGPLGEIDVGLTSIPSTCSPAENICDRAWSRATALCQTTVIRGLAGESPHIFQTAHFDLDLLLHAWCDLTCTLMQEENKPCSKQWSWSYVYVYKGNYNIP